MPKKNPYRSSKLAERKRRKKKIRIIIGSIFSVVLIIGVVFWFNHESMMIDEIVISDNEFINNDDLREDINEILNKKYIGIFPKKNFLILPKKKIKTFVFENNLSAREVRIKRRVNKIEVNITEHVAVSKWCGLDFNVPDVCYLINDQSLIFTQEKILQPKEVIKLYGLLNSENILGEKYLSMEVYDTVIAFVNNLEQLEIIPEFVDTTDQETFAVYTERGPYLLIKKNDDPNEVLNNLKTVIETEELNAAQFKNLEYIDLRFGNKVYYKIL